MSKPKTSVEFRLWSNVEKKGECWEWKGCRYAFGYGKINIDHKTYRTHRIAYQLIHGSIPDGLLVRHTCDNPPCCNPDHLVIGTHADNSDDKIARGRERYKPLCGEMQYRAKLTSADVLAIREAYKHGDGLTQIASRYNVTKHAIFSVVRRITWKHI